MRLKLKIDDDDPNPYKIISNESFVRLAFQYRIDKLQGEIGPAVKNCHCTECKMRRLALNIILMIADTLRVKGLEYDDEVEEHLVCH